MTEEVRESLINDCIRIRAELEGLTIEDLAEEEIQREQSQLAQLSNEELVKELEWLIEVLFFK